MDKTGEITSQTPDDQQIDVDTLNKQAGADQKDHPSRRLADAVKTEAIKPS